MNYIDTATVKLHDRTWVITSNNNRACIITLFGKISCGDFKLIDCDVEGYLEIPKSMIGNGDYFALRADGDSMTGAGINDGDLVIVQKNLTPDDGQIAVVMTEDVVTLKKFFRLEEQQKYLLRPDNHNYSDIIVTNCTVLGIAIKVIKDL